MGPNTPSETRSVWVRDLNPIEVDLSAFVSTGSNDVSIDASEGVDAIARIGLSYGIP